MPKLAIPIALLTTILIIFSPIKSFSGEWDLRGDVAFELRIFPEDPAFTAQDNSHFSPSFKAEPELIYEWNDARDRFTFVPFFRFDLNDDNRTHFDIRELNWLHQSNRWSLVIGAEIVYWGVTESRHLVNIINQDDRVEDIDEEDKLGQPMINFTYESSFGAFDFFYLPYFRERTFPDDDGRLRGTYPISENAKYESDLKEFHPDFALRWFHTVSDFDLGLSFFWGTSREPRLIPEQRSNGQIVLRQFYDIINQTGIDIQWTRDAWLLKVEAIGRGGQGDYFVATVFGFEYTLFQIFNTNADFGILSEYLYDGRDSRAPLTIFDHDIFYGARVTFNDIQDTEILGGLVTDTKTGETSSFIETSRRIGQNWLFEIESRIFFNTDKGSPLSAIDNDSFLTLRISRFF